MVISFIVRFDQWRGNDKNFRCCGKHGVEFCNFCLPAFICLESNCFILSYWRDRKEMFHRRNSWWNYGCWYVFLISIFQGIFHINVARFQDLIIYSQNKRRWNGVSLTVWVSFSVSFKSIWLLLYRSRGQCKIFKFKILTCSDILSILSKF